MHSKTLYAKVIPPLKLRRDIFYAIPGPLRECIIIGSQVKINLAGREYIAAVSEISESRGGYNGKVKEVIATTNLPVISEADFAFWKWISDYYMCTVGEVYKAAYPGLVKELSNKKSRTSKAKSCTTKLLPELSIEQEEALSGIKNEFSGNNPVILRGEPGSGKSELYFRLTQENLNNGKSTLLILPEIALSQQIIKRAQDYFPENILIYNSKQTSSAKLKIIANLAGNNIPYLIIGVRSAIFLPFRNLGLVIVDEEQDPSFKQFEPAPRYNARDSSIVLAKLHKAQIILGSSTPSFESLLNISEGKLSEVKLSKRFHEIPPPDIKIVETVFDTKNGKMHGILSGYLVEMLRKSLADGDQALIVSAKKNVYSPQIELSTKIIEKQLKDIFPEAKIVRYDIDTSSKKSEEKKILNDFTSRKYDILVSNKMTGKGFHFPGLNIAALLFAESLLNQTDFRSGERALQTIYQLAGRAGRENKKGCVIIQTASVNNAIFLSIRQGEDSVDKLMKERKEFGYPPFIRIIHLTISGNYPENINKASKRFTHLFSSIDGLTFDGPFDPENFDKSFSQRFILKIPKSKSGREIKRAVNKIIADAEGFYGGIKFIIDVDPL
jgi:primosomal protein N' (replication factor Y)